MQCLSLPGPRHFAKCRGKAKRRGGKMPELRHGKYSSHNAGVFPESGTNLVTF